MTWNNISNLRDVDLARAMKRYQAKLDHKKDVLIKHQPGTPYHTRAMREAEMYTESISTIQAELNRRKQNAARKE